MIFIPATVTIGLALIWWLFRRWLAVMLAGIAIGVVVNSTVAFYVLLDQPFTLISSIIPPLLSALTVAALVHLFNALHLASKRGFTGHERVTRAIAEIDRPALFAALTTAGGLASLATSPIVPIKVFGLISAAGTLLIYAVVFRILPNIVARWDRRSWVNVKGGTRLVDRMVSTLYRAGLRHPLIVITLFCTAMIVGAPQIRNVAVETNLQEFFAYDHPVRRDTRHIDEKLIGTMPVAVMFDTASLDALKNPQVLAQIRDFQRWVEQQPEIDRSFGLVDFIEEMHWGFNGEKPEFRKLPDDPQLISQYLLIYDGEDLYDFVDRDFQHSLVTLNLNIHSANAISQSLEKIRAYLAQNMGDEVNWEIAGMGRLFADMEDLLVAGQVYSLWGALILIFVFMLFLLRSFGAAVICMIPNLSPIFLIFVIMGAAGIWLDMATAMIASVAIGIAVDDTIHVYHGFQKRIAKGVSPVLSLARTYRGAGRAVVTTTLILSAQFLILMWSDFVPTRNFGLLTTVGLVTALLFDLLLLPALLIVIHGRNSPVAAFLGRFSETRQKGGENEPEQADTGLDEACWTSERKIALVKEIMSGKIAVAAAARQYALPEVEVEKWLATADTGINEAFGGVDTGPAGDPDKIRALAKAYRLLQAENRELKAHRQE
jgi:predicted RND superfamily exporter protein/transposase-like protein